MIQEEQKELFYSLINNHNRDICCAILGTTKPTLQRWIAQDEWPSYVDIILEQRQRIYALEKSLDYEKMRVTEVKQTVHNFVNASEALKLLLLD